MLPALLLQFATRLQEPGGELFAIHVVTGIQNSAEMGWDVALVGDLNQDGFAEYILGAPLKTNQGSFAAGAVYVVDGATGQFIREHQGTDVTGQFGWTVCLIGDLNLDGVPEYGVSTQASPGQMGAYVFDGATGAALIQIVVPTGSRDYGNAMDGVGDWNGDGTPDFAVSDNFIDLDLGRFTAGIIYIYSGADGSILQRIEGYSQGHQLGKGICGGGDVDGDGVQDLLAWSAWLGTSVHVLQGGTGVELYRLDSLTINGYFGDGLGFMEDVDGDGCDEILVGATAAGVHDQGEAYLFSGRTGALIFRWYGQADHYSDFGEDLACVGDLNKDGIPDVAVGSPGQTQPDHIGRVLLYSGHDGHHIGTISGLRTGQVGHALDGGMDVNGDGSMDLVLADFAAEVNGLPHVGAAMVFSFDPYLDASDRLLSASVGGTIAFALDFPVTEAGLDYRLLASTNVLGNQGPSTKPWMTLSGVTIPLVETALTHRMFNRPPAAFAGAQGTLDANGSAAVTLTLPPGAAASEVGRTFRFAAVSIQANGHASASSAAVLLTIEP